ncbi:hypothetical protein KUTeg_022969 [Tegillarca granosa]|uniref:Uncharacterized protein n=1 Tax=Tegillarca granosa TaxID=220873 RepID=A0ABQ9E097_TEGGR|nr:hypothetical protein KUTeg_022969 [Tegillarca granosa]
MKKIEVKPFGRQTFDDTGLKNVKSKMKHTVTKIGSTKTNAKPTNVDPFAVKVIDDMYTKTNMFSNTEIKKDLEKNDEELQQPNPDDQDIRKLWRDFMEDTSMHGIKHVNQHQQYKLRRIIWLIAVIGMGSFMAYSLWTLFAAYVKYPTMSNINFEFVDELPYPAVTICNVSPYKKSALNGDAVLDYYFLTISRMASFVTPLDYSNPMYADYNKPLDESWLQNISLTIDDMFLYCIESNTNAPCRERLTPYITEAGLCYTYNSYEYGKRHGNMKTSLTGSNSAPTFYIHINQDQYVYNQDLAAGIKVVLHDPSEEPDVYKYLPAPYKATANEYCIDTKGSDFVNPLKYQQVYSRYGCVRECKRDFIVSKCGCRSFLDHGNETICSLAVYHLCYLNNSAQFASNATLQAQCKCKLECEFTKYDAAVSSTYFPATVYTNILNEMGLTNHRTDWVEVRIFFDTLSYLSIQQIPEYTPEMLVGVIGGQMGIFLGASLLTLSELIEFIILSTYVLAKKMSWSRKGSKKQNT